MITYSQLGSMGRLGNALFQIASTAGIAKTNNQDYVFPYWRYSHYFENRFPTINRINNPVKVSETGYHFTPDHWEENVQKHPGRLISLHGWLQSEKYWSNSKEEILNQFKFKTTLIEKLRNKYQEVFSKKTIAISIRRGDFVQNPNYEQLPISYYVGALLKYFPNYKDYNIFCFSDDIPYCRHHFECLDNVYYPMAALDIEQLLLLSLCDNFIISQSTFSWWGAYLGEKPNSIIVRPNYNMAGDLLRNNNEKDYWPLSWSNVYDHKLEKINLKDTTFTIPVYYDHEDRAQNLRLNIDYLRKHFDTNIILGEQGGDHFTKLRVDQYIKFPYNKFHRTKMLNEMANESNTEIIVNWDTDVITPVMQLVEAVNALRNDSDVVYPYDGRFARVDRKRWYPLINNSLDTGIWMRERFAGTRPNDSGSVGGAVLFKKDSFLDGGMENENFISYAPEDQERWYRFRKLGYKVDRIRGNLYHIDHHIGPDSYTQHPLYKDNEKEFHRIRNHPNLRQEVDTWEWYHQYSKKYYAEIMEDSTTSRDEMFKIPLIMQGVKSIIDVGGGIGQWGKDLKNITYHMVDYNIPPKILVIPESNYREYDLTSGLIFPFPDKYDLALNLEVAEHIPESSAEFLVQLLTTKADKVLFSAAIPGQGGKNHCNEQFQTYWANLFQKHGFYPKNLDIRNNYNIAIWYRNNAILYIKGETGEKVEDYVHPELYTNIVGTHTKWKEIKPYSSK